MQNTLFLMGPITGMHVVQNLGILVYLLFDLMMLAGSLSTLYLRTEVHYNISLISPPQPLGFFNSFFSLLVHTTASEHSRESHYKRLRYIDAVAIHIYRGQTYKC